MSEENKQVTDKQVQQASDQIAGQDMRNTQRYIDEQMYRNNLLQSYLNKIEGKDQKDTDRQRQIFVTMARGIIGDIQASNPQVEISRSGEYTWTGVFDLAWEALYPKVEEAEEPEEAPVKEEKKPAAPPAQHAAPTRRVPGDIQPVDDGEELEGYVEKLGLKEYAKVRNQFRAKTKTLSGQRTNIDAIQSSIDDNERQRLGQ